MGNGCSPALRWIASNYKNQNMNDVSFPRFGWNFFLNVFHFSCSIKTERPSDVSYVPLPWKEPRVGLAEDCRLCIPQPIHR